MKKGRFALLLLGLALLFPLLTHARRVLPMDSRPLVAAKYAGWSGVLRLWVCDDGGPSVTGWLNRCIAQYEKRHPGVYVQPEQVEAAITETPLKAGILQMIRENSGGYSD